MPGAERFLVREELLPAPPPPPPLFSFWYSMGDWRAASISKPPHLFFFCGGAKQESRSALRTTPLH